MAAEKPERLTLTIEVRPDEDGPEHWFARVAGMDTRAHRFDRDDAIRWVQARALGIIGEEIAVGLRAPVAAVEFVIVDAEEGR